MSVNAWELMGRALKDYFYGDRTATMLISSDFAGVEEYPAHLFFRTEKYLPDLEQYALSICRGRVLDVGAGAGCHSLILQQGGLPGGLNGGEGWTSSSGCEVTALDISPDAVAVMLERGVVHAFCGDIANFTAAPFDTILMLMNGIGLVGDLPGLRRYLQDIKRLIKPDGQLLIDSSDLRLIPEIPDRPSPLPRGGKGYYGSITYQIEYRGCKSEPFHWLYLDQRTLRKNAAAGGWDCQVIYEESCQYLARLTRRESETDN